MEVAIANAELEFLEELFIFHNVQSVKDIKSLVFGKNQSILHELSHGVFVCNVVVGVSSP